jgi:acyl-CoA synthetase (AMP-forming)/AMP-acid ligase II
MRTAKICWVVENAREACEALVMSRAEDLDFAIAEKRRLSHHRTRQLVEQGFVLQPFGTRWSGVKSRSNAPSRISVFTSGTTGEPKTIEHSWQTLFTAASANSMARRWVVPYQIGTYAWYQLLTLGICAPSQSLVFPAANDPNSLFDAAIRYKADSISATPSLWRLCLLTVDSSRLTSVSWVQITLGGERVDQAILSRLRVLYPGAAITHIYASTEAGASVVVKDGREGFSAELLENQAHRVVQLRIRDGCLEVRSPYGARAEKYDDGWIRTGDIVAVRGKRVLFVGRTEGKMINVGGQKAFPADIERVLFEHAAVLWCRAYAVRAPIVGELPAVDVVAPGHSGESLEAELTKHCQGKLPDYAVPRMWNFVNEIPLLASMKARLR